MIVADFSVGLRQDKNIPRCETRDQITGFIAGLTQLMTGARLYISCADARFVIERAPSGPAPSLMHPTSQTGSDPHSSRDVELQALIRRFHAPLISFFAKRAKDRQEAADLVQELFCRLAAKSDTVRMASPDAYIFQMAANLLRDHARRQHTREATDRAIIEQSATSFEELSPERVLLARRRLAEVRKALAELPERTRAIFILHRFEELKHAEIAQRLGISRSSVEKHMMDAIRHLLERLERH